MPPAPIGETISYGPSLVPADRGIWADSIITRRWPSHRPMPLTSGTRLGPYEISGALGAGGMGEVYRARDTRLNRDVAVKVLPPDVAGDADRLRRFEDEARAAAALNHSNILAVYDVGTDAGVTFIVSELLEGRTLRQVLDEERLGLSRVVDLAAQIADGLAAAHARAIVHRDLKPENIFVTVENRAKILDFGLAKSVTPADEHAALNAPTRSATAPHTVLGTAGYMSPEQVRGQAIDHRADIFAFGAVLYEMLSGKRAFGGDTVLDTMTAILREAPAPVTAPLDRPLPPALLRLVERCLEKSPAARFQSTTDLAFALKSLSHVDSSATAALHALPASTATSRSRAGQLLPWAAAALFALTSLLLWQPWAAGVGAPRPDVVRFTIAPPDGMDFGPAIAGIAPFPAISPDGQQLAFTVNRPNEPNELWLRPLKGLDARPIPGASGSQAFWSPDGKSMAFFGNNKLQRVDLDSGVVQTLCDANGAGGGAWSAAGTILFSTGGGGLGAATGPIKRVAAAGGTVDEVTKLDAARKEIGHRRPSFLPDGRHFLYQAAPENAIWAGSLDGTPPKRLMPSDSGAVYVPPGVLVFVRQNTLFAQRFDVERLELVGDAFPIAEDVRTNEVNGRSSFTVSSTGVLVYRAGDLANVAPLAWRDRAGKEIRTIKGSEAEYAGLSLVQPDERSVIAHIHDEAQNGGDLWRIDLESGARSRVTSDPNHDQVPMTSFDGTMVAWSSNRVDQTFQIFRKPSSGVGSDEHWLKLSDSAVPWHWSRNWLVFVVQSETTRGDLWVAPLGDVAKARPYLQTEYGEGHGRLSPDEKWMAYSSSETERQEVYIRPFPDANAGKWTVSGTVPGGNPSWRQDGRELFYVAPGGRIMAVAITPGATTIAAGQPRQLFQMPGLSTPSVAIARDGQRFLVSARAAATETPTPLTVVINWPSLITWPDKK